MRQDYMILNGNKYTQGTIFVIKEPYHEKRMTFLYFDPEKRRYFFLSPNQAGLDSQVIYPDTRFMDNLLRTDQPTETELKILQGVLHRETLQKRAHKKWQPTGVDVFLLIILMIAIIAVFPPAGIIIGLFVFAYTKK